MNKYANLVGTNKIKDEYTKINTGFDGVETDIDALNDLVDALDSRIDTIITTPIDGEAAAQEIVDARVSAVKSKTFATLDARFEETEQDVESHMAEKVTQEQDGHMTKEDKIKLDGIEEGANKTDYYRNIAILPHDEEDKFNIGTNIYIPTVSSSNEYYSAWRAEIANILGVDDETAHPFRIVIETIKQHSSSMIQNVYVYSHYTSTISSHFFTFHRVYGFGNDKWKDWRIKRHISIYSEGSPEGVIYGIYGALCLDILNNKLYIKKGSKKISATNTGWELIGGA